MNENDIASGAINMKFRIVIAIDKYFNVDEKYEMRLVIQRHIDLEREIL